MIAFDLQCSNGHCFEGWFEDGDSFTIQNSEDMVSCPYCDSHDITKLMSTFTTRRFSSSEANYDTAVVKLKNYINTNFDDVGTDFATEALKMHYGVVKRKNIIGISTPEEEKTMNSEGVQFFRFPLFRKEDNRGRNN